MIPRISVRESYFRFGLGFCQTIFLVLPRPPFAHVWSSCSVIIDHLDSRLEYFLGFGWPCINFRDDIECLGTSLSVQSHSLLTYDDCAKECIGTPGCIMFNWEYKLSYGSVSQCILYSSGGFSKRCFVGQIFTSLQVFVVNYFIV